MAVRYATWRAGSALFARARPKVGIACDSSLCCAEAQRTRVAFGESV